MAQVKAKAGASQKKRQVRTVQIPAKVRAAPVKKPATAKSTIGKKKTLAASASKKPSVKDPVKKKTSKKVTAANVRRYRCRVCGYVYSPLRGEPQHGIPAGTPFEDLPEDYVCPICGIQGRGKIGTWGFDEWEPTKYLCPICGYIYDVNRGEPHRGIKPGTKFEDLPDDYTCPVCALDPKIDTEYGKVRKQGFEPLNL